MSKRKNDFLSSAITDFDNTKINFLSNKNPESDSIESLIHEWVDSRSRFVNEKKKKIDNKPDDLEEKFTIRSDDEKEYRINVIKNLHLEDKIKDDLLKDLIIDSNLINDPKLKKLEEAKNSVVKKMKIIVYFTVFYSFYAFAQYYDQRLNKFNTIQDLITNKPNVIDFKYKHHFLAYAILFGVLGIFYKQQKSIDNSYKAYVKTNHINLTDEVLKKYKVYLKI